MRHYLPKAGVDTVEYGDDKCRIIDRQAFVKANDLEDGGCRKENKREHDRRMSKLVSSVLVRQCARDQFHATIAQVSTSTYVIYGG